MAIQLQPELPSWINKVTFCFTIGLRPDHLARTLASLAPIMAQATVLAVNDFGDAPTNTAFARGCPHGTLVQTTPKIGQHAAVDAMYRRVTTPFVFHCEDDWMFDRNDIVPSALALLATDAAMSGVGFRHMSDFPAEIGQSPSIRRTTAAGVQHLRLDDLHDQWYGLSYDFPRLPCDKGAAGRHDIYAGQRRGTDRAWVGRHGPRGSMIAPVFSFDLNGYQGVWARMTSRGKEKTHAGYHRHRHIERPTGCIPAFGPNPPAVCQ